MFGKVIRASRKHNPRARLNLEWIPTTTSQQLERVISSTEKAIMSGAASGTDVDEYGHNLVFVCRSTMLDPPPLIHMF